MVRCPYCAEEIQAEAVKCKHCGEWLDKLKAPTGQIPPHGQVRPNYSAYQVYGYQVIGPKRWTETKFVLALNVEQAVLEARRHVPQGYAFNDRRGVWVLPRGRFTCPNCGSQFTASERDIGCAIMIIIFISLGLGLLLIPFLPFKNQCNACGYRWK